MIKPDAVTDKMLARISDERTAQSRKNRAWDCAEATTSPEMALGVLVEEVGEVGKAILEGEGDHRLRDELVQVAAVACAMAEAATRRIAAR